LTSFHPARLTAREDVGGGLTLIRLAAGAAIGHEYTSPGQYVEVRAGTDTGYFVLASEPGLEPWELIMRSGGGASDVLLAAPIGTGVEVTSPIGRGFPMASGRGRQLVVALGGTGVAAGRPLVRARISTGDAHRTVLLVGVRTAREVALAEDLTGWAEAGVLVTICLSQDTPEPLRRLHEVGHVHGVLRTIATRSPASIAGALLFAVGPESMIEALRRTAPEVGIRHEDVLTNY
jgi:anaerobic sulfite reductase subunit B